MARWTSLSLGSSLSPMPNISSSAGSPMNPSGASYSPMGGGLRRTAPGAELATALRRSRSALFRSGEETSLRSTPLLSAGPAGRRGAQALRRWEPQVRIDTAVASLLSALHFAHGSWWHLPVFDGAGLPAASATRLVTLTPPADIVFRDAQLPLVHAAAAERDDRLPEILSQADAFWPFWTTITNLDDTNAPRTVELIEVLMRCTHSMVMRVKHELAVPRPVDWSSTLGPIIATPGHASFPSGHATVSFMVARFLGRLLDLGAADATRVYLQRLAHRIAQSRVVAGVHFPIDSVAGRLLGETLAEYFYARCTGAAAEYADAAFADPADPAVSLAEDDALAAVSGCRPGTQVTVVPLDPLLEQLWKDAQGELTALHLL